MHFKLKRHFLVLSLGGIFIAAALLSMVWHDLATVSLTKHETRNNVAIASTFVRATGAQLTQLLKEKNSNKKQYLATAKRLRTRAQARWHGLRIARVDLYNSDGRIIFSSVREDTGKHKRYNPGFTSAHAGRVYSKLSNYPQFASFDITLENRDLLSTFVPVSAPVIEIPSVKTGAVVAIYSDVTDGVAQLRQTQQTVIIGLGGVFLLLLAIQLIVVVTANRILREQEKDRQNHIKTIRYQKNHDSLTGLPNKTRFTDQLGNSLARATSDDNHFTLMFIDLDRFRVVNDSLGHDIGDDLLKTVAGRIQNHLRTEDILYRWDGDAFALLLSRLTSRHIITSIASRIINSMSRTIIISGHEINITTSIGIVTCHDQSKTVESLISGAHAALCFAKTSGRNCYRHYTPAMNQQGQEKLALENGLKRAVQQNEFVLYYQPKISLSSGKYVGVEALLRWQHPTRGLVSPLEFIPSLEETGLINTVGEWVIRTACQQQKDWQQLGITSLNMSANISAKQFHNSGLVSTIETILRETGLAPSCLDLELTESLFIHDVDNAIKKLAQLKKLGVTLSIDDFGSGFSSLSYLKRLPVDHIKVDRSFIKDLPADKIDAAITTAISVLAHNLDIKIIAEGVENREQLDILKSQGCHEIQGYYFSHPLPSEAMTTLLQKHQQEDSLLVEPA